MQRFKKSVNIHVNSSEFTSRFFVNTPRSGPWNAVQGVFLTFNKSSNNRRKMFPFVCLNLLPFIGCETKMQIFGIRIYLDSVLTGFTTNEVLDFVFCAGFRCHILSWSSLLPRKIPVIHKRLVGKQKRGRAFQLQWSLKGFFVFILIGLSFISNPYLLRNRVHSFQERIGVSDLFRSVSLLVLYLVSTFICAPKTSFKFREKALFYWYFTHFYQV